jgi:MFS superfamily sulfate permease-like transporter
MKLLSHVRADLTASIVVFLVALPLCMGIAIASGVPPAAGLLSGIIGGIVVGAIAGAPLQVSGPAAGLTVLVWDVVTTHGIAALGPVVAIAGLVQVAAGLLGFGRWFRAIAPPVVYGMLAGIGVLIFASQFHVMVDDKPAGGGVENLLSIPRSIIKGVTPSAGTSHHDAALLGLFTIVVLVLWAQFRPARLKAVPGPLVAIVGAVGLAIATGAPVQYVSVPDDLLGSLTFVSLGDFSRMPLRELVVDGIAMAIVASAETLLCAVAVDRMQTDVRTDYNRELLAQGIGNSLCAVVGALPMTGVIVRSSANVDSGGKTRLSAMLHGVWLLAFVVAVPALLRYVPTASLAAILVYTGYKLVNPMHIRELRQYGRTSVVIYAATIVGIVVTDLLTGVVVGVVMSAARLLYRLGHLQVDVRVDEGSGRIDVHLSGAATFISIPKITGALEALPNQGEAHVHLEQVTYIDHAALVAIGDWEKQERARGRSVALEWERVDDRSERDLARAA